jgi:hypothetical protein
MEDYAGQQIIAVGATKDSDAPTVVQLFSDGRVDFMIRL